MTKTNAERLERIKETIEKARNYLDENKNDGDVDFSLHDELALSLFDNEEVDWLIQLAERNQTLESSMGKAIEMQEYYLITNGDLQDENKRFRDVLKDINENSSCTVAICYTRKVLEESK